MHSLEELSPEEFAGIFGDGVTLYHRPEFSLLNRRKTRRVHFLSIGEGKHRFGITLGDDGEKLSSPFSAPFGGLVPAKGCRINPERTTAALSELKSFGESQGKPVRITLPPPFYAPDLIAEQVNGLFRLGRLTVMDINYHFDVAGMNDYTAVLTDRAAIKNYRRAMAQGFEYESAFATDDPELFQRAYAVIRRNRAERGFPLRMTEEDMIETAPLGRTLCVVLGKDGQDIASAIIHTDVAPGIWQVVYWGDLREYSAARPMNALAPEVFRIARSSGTVIVDIGPSTLDSEPNYGLCSFKLSIGCKETLKPTFIL